MYATVPSSTPGDVVVRTDVVDDEDVGVVQGGARPRFLLETVQAFGVRRERGRKDLDGDVAAESGVLSLEHLAHSARPERAAELVRAEANAG